MTKNNFIALATALKAQMPMYTGDKGHMDYAFHCEAYQQWCHDVNAILKVCAQMNPRFHKGRFLTACGVPNLLEK